MLQILIITILGIPKMPNALLTAIKTNDYQAVYDLVYANQNSPLDVNFLGENPTDGLVEEEIEAIPLSVSTYLGYKKR
jgi:hypothetical protein